MKRIYILLSLVVLLAGCRQRKDIVILFDNDVHCAVSMYPLMASLRDSALSHTPNVAVVSAGDFAQGDLLGSLSQGEYIVSIMNAVPYDVTTIGNHEFDYGIVQQNKLADRLTADVVCCNLSDTLGNLLYTPYSIKQYGDRKVAFVGAATPTTFTSATPTFFEDSLGNIIFDFHTDDSFELIQQSVDEARSKGADYVIVLSHLGDDSRIAKSTDMVAATRGIDVVLDGHSHHFLDLRLPNADGDTVMLLSTGSKGQRIGCLTIKTDGALVSSFCDPMTVAPKQSVADTVEHYVELARKSVSAVVGYCAVNLIDRDEDGNRIIRMSETNLSDFVADALRYVTGAQIGVIHGGSLRSSVFKGDITMAEIISLLPFNNHLAKVSMTGQQLLDAMEVAVADYPEESGDFHICSGLRYTIDPSVPSSVVYDKDQLFVSVGATRRIVKMEVEDPKTHKYKPIDLNATYTIGGLDYTLLQKGAAGMYRYSTPLPCEPMKDTEVVLSYIKHLGDTIPAFLYGNEKGQVRFAVVKK